uniref:BTB domain-containing protein n=1 Tax=Megaselia scalaris TaxID=36166 RepID=T1GVK9_MEGSC
MDKIQQYNLKWTSHGSEIISGLGAMVNSSAFVDCTLSAEGKFLQAHKVILSACSPYFAAILSANSDKHPIFVLHNITFQELQALMAYMYNGEEKFKKPLKERIQTSNSPIEDISKTFLNINKENEKDFFLNIKKEKIENKNEILKYKKNSKILLGIFKCIKCERSYKNKGHLLRHMNLECGVEPKFKCEICGTKFSRKETVKRHILRTHSKRN